MSETLKFNDETVKENWATNSFKAELTDLQSNLEKDTDKEIYNIRIEVVKSFLETNNDKDRSYRIEGLDGKSGKITTATQIALKHLGINPGTIDGKYGPQTIAAVNLFKSKMDITENGIGPNTIGKIIEQLTNKTITITEDEESALPANKATTVAPENSQTSNNTDNNAVETDVNKAKTVEIKDITELESTRRKDNTIKVLMFDNIQYGFFNNGKVYTLNNTTRKYENGEKSEDLISRINSMKEDQNNTTPFNEGVANTIISDVNKEMFSIINELKVGKEIEKYIKNRSIVISSGSNPYFSLKFGEDSTKFGEINGHILIENGSVSRDRLKTKLKEIITEKAITEARNKNINTSINSIKNEEKYINIKDLGVTENVYTKTLANSLGNGDINFGKIEKIGNNIRVGIRGINIPYNIPMTRIMNKENSDIDDIKFQQEVKAIINAEIKKLEPTVTS